MLYRRYSINHSYAENNRYRVSCMDTNRGWHNVSLYSVMRLLNLLIKTDQVDFDLWIWND